MSAHSLFFWDFLPFPTKSNFAHGDNTFALPIFKFGSKIKHILKPPLDAIKKFRKFGTHLKELYS